MKMLKYVSKYLDSGKAACPLWEKLKNFFIFVKVRTHRKRKDWETNWRNTWYTTTLMNIRNTLNNRRQEMTKNNIIRTPIYAILGDITI